MAWDCVVRQEQCAIEGLLVNWKWGYFPLWCHRYKLQETQSPPRQSLQWLVHTLLKGASRVQQGASTSPHQPSVTPRTRAAPLLNASPMQLPGETSFHKRLLQLKKTRNSPKPLPALFRSQNHLSDLPTCLKTKHCYKRTDKTPF